MHELEPLPQTPPPPPPEGYFSLALILWAERAKISFYIILYLLFAISGLQSSKRRKDKEQEVVWAQFC